MGSRGSRGRHAAAMDDGLDGMGGGGGLGMGGDDDEYQEGQYDADDLCESSRGSRLEIILLHCYLCCCTADDDGGDGGDEGYQDVEGLLSLTRSAPRVRAGPKRRSNEFAETVGNSRLSFEDRFMNLRAPCCRRRPARSASARTPCRRVSWCRSRSTRTSSFARYAYGRSYFSRPSPTLVVCRR